MTRLYTLLLMTLMTLFASNAIAQTNTEKAKPTPVTVKIDNVDRVTVRVNWDQPLTLVNGENKVEVPQYGSLTFEATEGNFLASVIRSQLGKETTEQAITAYKTCKIYISNLDKGSLFDVQTGNLAEARNASMTLTVDDATKVGAQIVETQSMVRLSNGTNDIRFAEGSEKTLLLRNSQGYGSLLYKVTANGNEVKPNSEFQYVVNLTPGVKVDVQANYPDVDVPVKFNFSDPSVKGIISRVTVDNVEQPNFADDNFTVKAGKQINISFNTNNFALDEFKVNGKVTPIYGMYSALITAATTFDVKAHAYKQLHATVTIDNADNVTLYEGYSYQNKIIQLVNGQNDVVVNEQNNLVQLKPKSGVKIKNVTVNGETVSAQYDGTYEIRIADQMEINITTAAIVRDQKATVIVDDLSAAPYGFQFTRSDRSTEALKNGKNTVMFATDDNTFQFAAYGADANVMKVYLNGEIVNPAYPGSTSYQVSLKNGDTLEINIKGGTTGIETISSTAGKEQVVYRLDGTRVETGQLKPGLYIINGKKVIVRK